MTQKVTLDESIKVNLPDHFYQKVEKRARQNERSKSAEVRYLIKRGLYEAEA